MARLKRSWVLVLAWGARSMGGRQRMLATISLAARYKVGPQTIESIDTAANWLIVPES